MSECLHFIPTKGINMKHIKAFKTQDGRLFESKEEAEDHEFGQLLTEQLDHFSKREDCPYPEGVANSQMRKSITAWERSKSRPTAAGLIDDLQLTTRTYNILRDNKIHTIDELLTWSTNRLLRETVLGRKCVNEINKALANMGLLLDCALVTA